MNKFTKWQLFSIKMIFFSNLTILNETSWFAQLVTTISLRWITLFISQQPTTNTDVEHLRKVQTRLALWIFNIFSNVSKMHRKCLQVIANLWYLPLQTITNTITIVWNVWHTIDLFVSLHVWCNVQIIWQHETIQNVEFYMKSKSFWIGIKSKLLIQSFQL